MDETTNNTSAEKGSTEKNEEVGDPLFDEEKLESSPEEEKAPKRRMNREFTVQLLLMLLPFFGAASSGMAMGYPAVLLPQLKLVNGSLHTDEEMGSWIASIFPASTPIGSLLSGVMIHYLGRMATLKIQMCVSTFSWVFVIFCQDHTVLLIGRLVAGVGSGLGIVAGQVYTAEVSTPRMRGVISSVPFLSYAFGILLVYALGSALEWRLVAGLSMVLPVSTMFLFFIYPESPVWLVRQGHIERAKKASLWLRGSELQAKQEVQQLMSRVEHEKLQEQHNQSTWAVLCTPQVLKPFVISNLFNFLQTLTGIYLMIFYAVDIISEVGGASVNRMFAAVLSAVIRLVFTIAGCALLAFVGRRTLGLWSALGTGVSSFILGTYLYLSQNPNGYFASTFLLIYVAANTVGLLILPAIMMGELFPAKARSLAGSLTYTIFSLCTFGIAKVFPLLKDQLRTYGMFWLFAASSLLISLLIYLVLPETKNRTLNDIEDYFLQDNILWMNRKKDGRNGITKDSDTNNEII